MKAADSSPLPKLNDDVIFEVFKFLSLPDRKRARLVCKQWHRISNRRLFAKKEAFFISNMYKFQSVVEVLSKCQRKMLNLKFDQRLFDKDSNLLWWTCGNRIQSLTFYMCRFPPNIVRRIFINCKKLNEFSACGGGIVGFCFFNENLPRTKSILQVDDSLVRPNLKTLHLDSLALALRGCDLHTIASVFPQLTSLRIQLLLNDVKEKRDSPNFTFLLNLLDTTLNQLEDLHVKFPYHYEIDPIDFTSVSKYNLDRLKNVSTSLDAFISNGESLNKILHYKFWTSLKISWFRTSETDLTVLTRLLDENPALEKLDVFVILSSISHFCDLFRALVRSRLKDLKIETSDGGWPIDFSKVFISAVTSSFDGLACNQTVEYLSISSRSSAEFSSLFVKYFQNVHDLCVRPGDVNTVFQYQKNLKSLRIEPLGVIKTDKPPAQSSINSLELLDIRPLVLDVFSTYEFPNLKYLVTDESKVYYEKIQRLETDDDDLAVPTERNGDAPICDIIVETEVEKKKRCNTEVFIEKMNKLMASIYRKSPHLEAIEFECDYSLDAQAFVVFFQSCLHFYHLRFVSFYSYSPCLDKVALKREVVKYCKKCPSLRGLWFETLKFNIFFYYNVVTQKYEFSNEFSYDYIPEGYFFGIRLHEFWRYKR